MLNLDLFNYIIDTIEKRGIFNHSDQSLMGLASFILNIPGDKLTRYISLNGLAYPQFSSNNMVITKKDRHIEGFNIMLDVTGLFPEASRDELKNKLTYLAQEISKL